MHVGCQSICLNRFATRVLCVWVNKTPVRLLWLFRSHTHTHTHTHTNTHTCTSQCLNRCGDMIIKHTHTYINTNAQMHTYHTHTKYTHTPLFTKLWFCWSRKLTIHTRYVWSIPNSYAKHWSPHHSHRLEMLHKTVSRDTIIKICFLSYSYRERNFTHNHTYMHTGIHTALAYNYNNTHACTHCTHTHASRHARMHACTHAHTLAPRG